MPFFRRSPIPNRVQGPTTIDDILARPDPVVDAFGFLVVDKPGGVTSHDVVAAVRRATGVKKCGHAGTLDPMATGVVVVAIGRATRLIRFVQDAEKEYLATARFGVATDSLDADGEEVGRAPLPTDLDAVTAVAAGMVGTIRQVPPMVSALKHEGRRLYELARQGVEVDRAARPVQIHELDVLEVGGGSYPDVRFRVVCGKGTYVRSLADDMAGALGGRAHLTALRRTRIGRLTVDRGLEMDRLANWSRFLIAPQEALAHLPEIRLDAEQSSRVANGGRIACDSRVTGPARVIAPGGSLIAVSRMVDGRLVHDVVVA